MANTLHPTLDNLISVEHLPTEFPFAQSAVSNLLENTFYKNHSFVKSKYGDYATINLDIVLYKEFGLKIPGTDLSILLNAGQATNETVIPLVLQYNWRILKYLNLFTQDGFPGSPKAFFDILISLSGSSPEELLKQAIVDSIPGGGNTQDITDWINEYNNPSQILTVTPSSDLDVYIANLKSELEANNVNPETAVFIQNVQKGSNSFQEAATKMEAIFTKWLGDFTVDNIKDFLIPKFKLTLNSINVSLQFPRNILTPGTINASGDFVPESDPNKKASLVYNVGSLSYDSQDGFEFYTDSSISLPQPTQILNTGLILEVHRFKIDLSRTRNIPEADADGRPQDFIGAYLLDGSISFPKNLNSDTTNARIYARNLLVGTGGISGFLGLEPLIYPSNPTDPPPAIKFRLGDTSSTSSHFEVGLHTFDMEFKQNAIVTSDLKGYLKIPGFLSETNGDAKIDISMHIAANGDIKITASSDEGYTIKILDAVEINLRSISIGRTGDRWYLDASGTLTIIAAIPGASSDFAAHPIEITHLRIWQDGSIEFQGGGIPLPTHISLKIGPVALQLEHLTFGSHISKYGNIDRQYFFFGFDGNLSTGSGGVDVRGDGMEFHFTRSGTPFHSYLRVAGIGVDIKIPGNATKETADVYFGGYLSMRNGVNPNSSPTLKPDGSIDKPVVTESGPEYQGSVAFNIKKLKISGKGSMLMKPKVPAWIVDVELGLSTPITLGATGLGIYGFRGLIGNHYVASRTHIGLSEEDSWYEYLKKKVAPSNKQGITVEKFDPARNGFSFGVGATIATMGDDGWTFSSKLFVMLSMPEMLLIEGQANVLHRRLGINDEEDPPFYAYLVVDSNSIQAGLGVNYGLPGSGAILKLQGEMQLGFFFNNSSAWYLNIGKDYPTEKRVQARLFNIFNAYAYLMVSARGIKAGAGANWALNMNFGPVSAGLEAYIDTMGFISFKPVQIGGAIQLGGRVYISVFGIEFSIEVHAGLSAEAPNPFIIAGYLEIRFRIIKRFRIRIGLTWIISEAVNTSEVKLLTSDTGVVGQSPFKATHMLTEERFDLLDVSSNTFNPGSVSNWEPYTIPMDSYIDIEFKYPVKPFLKDSANPKVILSGGIAPAPQSTILVAPQKARYPQVKHDLSVENVKIQIWKPTTNTWEDYNPWEALTSSFAAVGINANTSNFPFGYWQYNNNPGKYTSLRLLAQSPFAMLNGTPPEQFGLLSSQLLCAGVIEKKTCQNWISINRPFGYSPLHLLRDRALLLYFNQKKGSLDTIPNVYGIQKSLKIQASNKLEITFNEPVCEVTLKLSSILGYKIIGYKKVFNNTSTLSGLQSYSYVNVYEKEVMASEFAQTFSPLTILSTTNPIDKLEIIAHDCDSTVLNGVYDDYMDMLIEKMNFALLNPDLTTGQKTEILDWLKQYTIKTVDVNFRILNELCPVWEIMQGVNSPIDINATGASYYLEHWIGGYCGSWWSSDLRDYIFNTNGMCDQWADLITEIDNARASDDLDYFKILEPYIRIWKLKYCNSSQISGFTIYDLYTTWTKLFANTQGLLSLDELDTLEFWLNSIQVHWNQFSNIKNNLCSTANLTSWGTILQSFVGTNPFHQYVLQWRNEYCLGNYAPMFDKCSLFIHEVCWLTQKQWNFNYTLQQNNLSLLNQSITTLVNAVNETLSPVWRPNSYFLITINTKDAIDTNGARAVTETMPYPYRANEIKVAFKTGMPIGFYHLDKKEFEILDRENKADQFKLSGLRHYIDYQRSYPNADSKLVNAKPLYYSNPRLGLFFTKTYVSEFFTQWASYKGTPEEKFELLCRIKDPIDSDINASVGREKVIGWELHKTEPIPTDALEFEVLTNVLTQGNPNCVNITTSLKPPTVSGVVDYNLLPQKLYTALFKVKYYGDPSKLQPIVHSYNFQTSRYSDFDTHIRSMYRPNKSKVIKAQFPIKMTFANLGMTQAKFIEIIDKTLLASDPLMTNYASVFDRIMNGLFGMESMQAVTDVEINVLRTREIGSGGKKEKRIIGVLVKSPEPFNDPKLPDDIMAQTFQFTNESDETTNDYVHIFSKDNSCIFITNRNLNIPLHRFRLDFRYAQFDGKKYTLGNTSSLKVYVNRI